MALAICCTAMAMKPSATSSALRPVRCASSANRPTTASLLRGSFACGPNTLGKYFGWILPTITLASVTASGPPRR
jgi:hypothetical protein